MMTPPFQFSIGKIELLKTRTAPIIITATAIITHTKIGFFLFFKS